MEKVRSVVMSFSRGVSCGSRPYGYSLRVPKVIGIALLLLFIQGCKITQEVPAGGAIVSRTGTNDCAGGQTCTIDIPGVAFSDTFTAVPDAGYRFTGWDSGLCGGSTSPCALEGISASFTAGNNIVFLRPKFEELTPLELLPENTRGVLQIYPTAPGALDSAATPASWGADALRVMKKYSAGMNLQGTAQRLLLAQLSDTPDQFVLLAELGAANFASLTAAADLTQLATQPLPLWSIGATGLQLTLINNHILAIAAPDALQLVMNVATGAEDPIAEGLLAPYLPALDVASAANSFVYGLPALYAPVTAPGTGANSLSQAKAVNGFFTIQNKKLIGAVNFFTDNAPTYAAKLQELLQLMPAGYRTPATTVVYGNIVSVSLNGLTASRDVRPLLKTLILDMDTVDYTAAVVHGGNPPWLNFKVGEDPGAIFVNYEFKGAAERTAFEAAHLPAGIKLAPIPIIDGETPRYYMVQNMYQSTGGLVEGARSEWSVFVEDPEDPTEPRFFVVDPKAATISADPVNLLTFGWPVTHTLTPTAIESYIAAIDPLTQVETMSFSSTINWPQSPETRVSLDRGFMATNDYVFWGHSVADRILYNTTAQNPEVVLVDPNQFTVVNNSPLAVYVNPDPVHAVVYLNPQEIVISPWWNLDASYLDLTPLWRQTLIDFKNGFYPLTVQGLARDALRGKGALPVPATVSDSVPTAHYHFVVTDPVGLLASIFPGAYTSAPVALFEGEPAGHYLTLSVYKRENDPCGVRAQWTTYVVGQNGRPETLRLNALAADACLDSVSLLTLPSDVTQSVAGDLLETRIASPFTQFNATVDLSLTDEELAGADWLEAGDRVCAPSLVCDKFYYDGLTIMVPALRAGAAALQVDEMTTPWDAYIDASSARASLRVSPSILASNPWHNLPAFPTPPLPGC